MGKTTLTKDKPWTLKENRSVMKKSRSNLRANMTPSEKARLRCLQHWMSAIKNLINRMFEIVRWTTFLHRTTAVIEYPEHHLVQRAYCKLSYFQPTSGLWYTFTHFSEANYQQQSVIIILTEVQCTVGSSISKNPCYLKYYPYI